MKRTSVLMISLGLVLMGVIPSLASPAGIERPAPLPSDVRFLAQETVTSGQLVPDKGELPPGPELTPEERERLLQRTQRVEPNAVDNHLRNPPGLPLVPGRETKIVDPSTDRLD